MATEKRLKLIDYDEVRNQFDEEYKKTAQLIREGETHLDNLAEGFAEADKVIWKLPTVDAVEVVRCKDCKSAEPYTRMDGKTGFYCKHQKCTLRYGTNWERLYMPIKEADDFCSYGERRSDG